MTDRLPPSSPESEQAIIGCCLNTPIDSLPDCQAVLTDSSFYDHRNKAVWKVICELPSDRVNIITIRERLRESDLLDKIGDAYLCQCQEAAFSSANLSIWLDEVLDKETLRSIIARCTDFITKAYAGGSVSELLDELEREVLAIRPNHSETPDIRQLVNSALIEIEYRCVAGGTITGLPTGLSDLNVLTDGLHKGEMIVVCGFPSTGKTALAVNIAVTNAMLKNAAVIFSAEMRPVKLAVRSICSESNTNFYRIQSEQIPRIINAAEKLASSRLIIEQANRLSIGKVISRARRLKQTHNIKLAVVDYIQLLTGTGDNREQEISSISKGIKAMAMELEIPVLALSQLTDDGKLRESRAIGQDADTVWKLENDGDWKPDIQPIKLKVEKCRDGATGVINLTFFKEYTRFEDAVKISDEDVPD